MDAGAQKVRVVGAGVTPGLGKRIVGELGAGRGQVVKVVQAQDLGVHVAAGFQAGLDLPGQGGLSAWIYITWEEGRDGSNRMS